MHDSEFGCEKLIAGESPVLTSLSFLSEVMSVLP
jgi:hypothetical protein